MISTVVCTDLNPFINWQCELLEYSWKRAGQPGELVRLVTADSSPPALEHTRVVRIAESSDRAGGYRAFERLFALQDWLRTERPVGTVLVLDPDCVFRDAISREVAPGLPVAQLWVNADRSVESQPATWPALIHTDDLAALLPPWIAFTRAIHQSTRRWESDMYGFVAAARSIGLRFSLEAVGAFVGWPDESVAGAPIIHYCQDVLSKTDKLIWSKRSYTPWEHVPRGEPAQHAYCEDLLDILNEYVDQGRSDATCSKNRRS